jgi:hypothetical protein
MEEFDESKYNAKPWDILNNTNYTEKEIRDIRYDLCKQCDKLFKPTRTCRECGCFMAAKTWLKHAECPIGKWGKV